MLFQSTLRRELARSFGATLVVLVTVVMTMTLIRTLGQATRGGFAPADVTLVMGYTVLAYTPTLLTLSMFLAIIHTLARMHRDSEMVIWFSSGKGLAASLRPVAHFAWPILLVVSVLSLGLLPWSNQQIETLKSQYESRGDLDRVQPGQFQESGDGTRVFFVEKDAGPNGTGTNVFIATSQQGKETMTSARSGRVDVQNHGKYLLLNNGERLESTAGRQEIKISTFEEYGTRISDNPEEVVDNTPANTLSTTELLRRSTAPALAEFAWRIGLILAGINLAVLGVALSGVNPRSKKNMNFAIAIFIFIIYYNIINLGQSWIANQQISWPAMLLLVHGSFGPASIIWLAKSHFSWHWRDWTQKPGSIADPLKSP
jgi:lipopolysaccharide export system permease protein